MPEKSNEIFASVREEHIFHNYISILEGDIKSLHVIETKKRQVLHPLARWILG